MPALPPAVEPPAPFVVPPEPAPGWPALPELGTESLLEHATAENISAAEIGAPKHQVRPAE